MSRMTCRRKLEVVDLRKMSRWFKVFLNLSAVAAGLLLVVVGCWWSQYVTRRALELPDTGGHWMEFLVAGFSGIGVLVAGGGLITASVYSLVATGCFKHRSKELCLRDRKVTILALWAGGGFLILAIAIGAFLLLGLLV